VKMTMPWCWLPGAPVRPSTATLPKEEQAGHVVALQEAIAGAKEKERQAAARGQLQLRGLVLPPKALGAVCADPYLQGVLQVGGSRCALE